MRIIRFIAVEERTESASQSVAHVDYDDKNCMTIYMEEKSGILTYISLNAEEIEVLGRAIKAGPHTFDHKVE